MREPVGGEQVRFLLALGSSIGITWPIRISPA